MKTTWRDGTIVDEMNIKGTTWNIEEAKTLINLIHQPVHNVGFMVALYGSMLYHSDSRDLDLLFVNWRPAFLDDILGVLESAGLKMLRTVYLDKSCGVYLGLLGQKSWVFSYKGKIVDVQVRVAVLAP